MQSVRRSIALCSLSLVAAAVEDAAAIALGSDADSGIKGRVVPDDGVGPSIAWCMHDACYVA
jgi:hypothetical protein